MTVGDPQEGGICQKGFRQLRTEFLGGDVATGWQEGAVPGIGAGKQ